MSQIFSYLYIGHPALLALDSAIIIHDLQLCTVHTSAGPTIKHSTLYPSWWTDKKIGVISKLTYLFAGNLFWKNFTIYSPIIQPNHRAAQNDFTSFKRPLCLCTDIKAANKHRQNESLNRGLQNFLYGALEDPHEAAAKKSLAVLIELWQRQVWRDARTVNVIGRCFLESLFSLCHIHKYIELSLHWIPFIAQLMQQYYARFLPRIINLIYTDSNLMPLAEHSAKKL